MARANHDVAEQAKRSGESRLGSQAARFCCAGRRRIRRRCCRCWIRERQAYQYGVAAQQLRLLPHRAGRLRPGAGAAHRSARRCSRAWATRIERATQLAALGALYFRWATPTRALETLRAAIVAQEKSSDTAPLASTLRVAGNAAATLGQHDLALEYLRRSARIDANQHGVSRTRVLIAGELRTIGDHRAARGGAGRSRSHRTIALVHADALAERARLRLAQKNAAATLADLRAADQRLCGAGPGVQPHRYQLRAGAAAARGQ